MVIGLSVSLSVCPSLLACLCIQGIPKGSLCTQQVDHVKKVACRWSMIDGNRLKAWKILFFYTKLNVAFKIDKHLSVRKLHTTHLWYIYSLFGDPRSPLQYFQRIKAIKYSAYELLSLASYISLHYVVHEGQIIRQKATTLALYFTYYIFVCDACTCLSPVLLWSQKVCGNFSILHATQCWKIDSSGQCVCCHVCMYLLFATFKFILSLMMADYMQPKCLNRFGYWSVKQLY